MTRPRGRSEFLSACHAGHSRNRALEEIRERGAGVILATFRMLKNSLVHDIDNNAVRTAVADTHATLVDFTHIVGGHVAITFADDTIFVCGQLLRASRSIYESAAEVGRLLSAVGVSELSFTAELTPEDLMQLCRAFSLSSRDPRHRQGLLSTRIDHIAVRKVDPARPAADAALDLPPMERTMHVYAVSLVVMRRFFAAVAAGHTALPHRVKRVAQRLVALADRGEMAMLALTSLANAHRDDAGRAVQSAILAVLMARRLTRNRAVLSQLAMTALLAGAGRVRLAGPEGLDRYVPLGDRAQQEVPALTGALFLAAGGVNLPNAQRTIFAYEAGHLECQDVCGPPYGGALSPMFEARMLHLARALLDKAAPRDGRQPLSPLDALASLAGDPAVDASAYKLLVKAIGLLPTGTVVEFETGEWGLVLGPSAQPDASERPCIKLLTDRRGDVLVQPRVIDLGDPAECQRTPAISAVVEPSRARFNVTAALLDGA